MMNKIHLSLLSCLLLGGCGTVFSGTTQNITIDSNVRGVSIFDGGMQLCQTPCTFQISRGRGEKYLVAKKKGYEETRVVLGSSINMLTLINITSLEGFTTDAISGAMWEYAPNNYYVNMMRNEKENKKAELVKKEIRRFVLKNYEALRAESLSDKNEYTKSLALTSGLEEAEIKQMCAEAVSQVLLAEEIAGLFDERRAEP